MLIYQCAFDSVTNFTFPACMGPNLVHCSKIGYKTHINCTVFQQKIIQMQLSDSICRFGFCNFLHKSVTFSTHIVNQASKIYQNMHKDPICPSNQPL